MKKLPKYLAFMVLSMMIWGAFSVSQVQAATVYSQSSYVDIQIPLGATSTHPGNHGYYIRLPNDTIFYEYDGSINGTPISVPSFDKIVIYLTASSGACTNILSNGFFYNGGNTPTNCSQNGNEFTISIVATTTLKDLTIIPKNTGGGWAVAGGSSLNPGISITNEGDSYTTNGGYAFLLCSSSCSTPFQIRASLDATKLLPGVSTSTVAAVCDSEVGTTTGILDSLGASIANGFCRVGVFLFVPSPAVLQQYSNLSDTSQSKIPFSYFTELRGLFNQLTATSSETVPTYAANLAATGVGSTTAIGNILPSLTWLSVSAIQTYLPAGIHDALFFLARCAIWFGVIMMFYRRVIPHKAKI